jgi:hypothetical protein
MRPLDAMIDTLFFSVQVRVMDVGHAKPRANLRKIEAGLFQLRKGKDKIGAAVAAKLRLARLL